MFLSSPPPAYTKRKAVTGGAFVAASVITITHNFGVNPKGMQARWRCLTAEGGYAIGDSILAGYFYDAGARQGQIAFDVAGTAARFVCGASIGDFLNKTTGAAFTPTIANWALDFEVWA